MPTEIRDLGHYKAVVDTETGRVLRAANENNHSQHQSASTRTRAENPQELVIHENPSSTKSHNTTDSIMDRENIEDAAGQYVDVLSQGASILAGDIVADQLFGQIDSALAGQNATIRKLVRVAGPGIAGVLVFNFSNNEIAQGVAVGHGLNSVRQIVDEGMKMLTGNGSSSSGSGTGTEGVRALPSGAGMEGSLLSEAENPTARVTGQVSSGSVAQGV